MFEFCENTIRSSPRQSSHSRLGPSEVLRSDGATAGARPTVAQAGGQPRRLHLHDAAGPARCRHHHDKTTTRRTASQPPRNPCRRLHGSFLARSGAAPPYHPADKTRRHVTHRTPGRPAARTPRRRQIARPNTGRPCASPSPSLRSTSASAWAAQAHRLPAAAVCANVNTCRRRASRYSAHRRRHRRETTASRYMPLPLEALMDFPQCRNLGPRHQSKFTLKKTFRAAHTLPLGDDHAEIFRNITLDRHNMPKTRRDMPQC